MTTDFPGTAGYVLSEHAYASDEKLSVRQRIHKQYTTPMIDFPNWVLDRIDWRGDERVLDLGAGPGTYFGPVKARIPNGQHVGGDLSFGMIRSQRENPAFSGSALTNLDAQGLPFAENSFDVVLANHMIYHIPDIEQALVEIRRVLCPEGVLLAATNSAKNMPELRTLHRRAVLLLTDFKAKDTAINTSYTADRFSLENAPVLLARHFFAVSRHDLPSALVFSDVAPVLEYIESTRDLREGQLPDGVTWEQFTEIIHQQVSKLINHAGRLVINKLTGMVIATNRGSFASDYVEMLDYHEH